MRNRIAHDYRTVDDDMVWAAVTVHAASLHTLLRDEIEEARRLIAEP